VSGVQVTPSTVARGVTGPLPLASGPWSLPNEGLAAPPPSLGRFGGRTKWKEGLCDASSLSR
jgi:hypothetical protein